MSPLNFQIPSSPLVSYLMKIALKSITSKYLQNGKGSKYTHADLSANNILIEDKSQVVTMIDGLDEAVENLTTEKYSVLLATIYATAITTKILSTIRNNESSKERKQIFPNTSIVGIYRKQKFQEASNSLGFLLFFLILTAIASLFFTFDTTATIVALLIPIILLLTRQLLTDYRIAKGYFVNNENEARELISFIISESSNIDFTDRGKLKKILSDDDLEEIRGMIPIPTPGAAD